MTVFGGSTAGNDDSLSRDLRIARSGSTVMLSLTETVIFAKTEFVDMYPPFEASFGFISIVMKYEGHYTAMGTRSHGFINMFIANELK